MLLVDVLTVLVAITVVVLLISMVSICSSVVHSGRGSENILSSFFLNICGGVVLFYTRKQCLK